MKGVLPSARYNNMEYKEFKEEMEIELKKIKANLKENEIFKFFNFMNLLLEWNEKINLTAITEPKQIILKHYIDSLTISQYLPDKSSIIDVGTGAGFPGIPIGITRNDLSITLLDSLNKRVNFLNEVIKSNDLKKLKSIHGRAEDYGQNSEYREKFDVATSRAVAPLNVLLEYLIPFVKENGMCICMKGPGVNEEIKCCENTLKELSGKIEAVHEIKLDDGMIRNVVIIRKIGRTKKIYPRKAGTPSKKPL